jgi:hypothetical protein
MIVSGGVLTLALALVTAQGPRAKPAASRSGVSPSGVSATAKKKRSAPPPSAPAEKRVLAPVRADGAGSGRRDSDVSPGARGGDGEGSPSSDIPVGAGPVTTKPAKTKVYTFGAMDVEGKLKTPQLLYFLNRVKLELEMSAPDHRSFMKELQKTADDPVL